MAHIQITNLNSSDSDFGDELTDEELLAINGGSISDKIHDVANAIDRWGDKLANKVANAIKNFF